MNLIALLETAKQEIAKAGLTGWEFRLHTAYRNAGECDPRFGDKIISINSHWAKDESEEQCRKILDEEIEHAVVCFTCLTRETCKENYHCKKLGKVNIGGI